MGTNFYIGKKHVGKLSSLGKGNGTKFTWAMHPSKFFEEEIVLCKGNIIEEVEQWLVAHDAIVQCSEFDYSLIGSDFS
jgi:hypothetical protein